MNTTKKIPTLLAVFLLFFTIGIISFAIQNITRFTTTASPSAEPKNVQVTNVSDTTATLIWQTDEPTTGLVTITKGASTLTSYDERDMTGKMNKYTTHSVSIKNLSPNSSYEVSILSNGKKYPSSGKPYQLQTGPTIATIPAAALDPAYGVIKKFDGRPAEGAVVTLILGDSQTLSTLVRSTGSWMIPLNVLRTKNLESYLVTETPDQLTGTLTAVLDSQRSEALIDAKNISPVPDITLGQTYDYRNYQAKNKTSQTLGDAKNLRTTPSPAAVLGEQTTKSTTPTPSVKIGGVAITSPLNKSSIVSTRPLVQGTGIPGKTVTITLGITKPQTGKVTVGENGLWQYTPTAALKEGKQSVTITSVDSKNKTIALTNDFTILKSGSQVLGDATPSATYTPTPTEASITAEPIPTSGSTLPTILLVIVGAGLLVGGAVLFIL